MTSPLAVKAQTAAAMLDMPQAEFITQSFAAMLRNQKRGLNCERMATD